MADTCRRALGTGRRGERFRGHGAAAAAAAAEGRVSRAGKVIALLEEFAPRWTPVEPSGGERAARGLCRASKRSALGHFAASSGFQIHSILGISLKKGGV